MNVTTGDKQARLQLIRTLVKSLHSGADPDELAKRYQQVLHGISAADIAEVEEDLIKEGVPKEEMERLCDVHLAVFREPLESAETLAPEWHPVGILMREHRMLFAYAQELARLAQQMGDESKAAAKVARLLEIEAQLKLSENHYVREENVLFPYIEKHGITGPPSIMWMEHNQIREIKKGVYGVIDGREGLSAKDFGDRLSAAAVTLAETLGSHFYKENKILFPTALRIVGEEEWPELRRQFDELGYCCFTPPAPPAEAAPALPVAAATVAAGGEISARFATGEMPIETLEALLNALPVDITYVDKDDAVRYYSQTAERIFPRTNAVLGRTVQLCHPSKSIHVVNRILTDFKAGKRDSAEFLDQRRRQAHLHPLLPGARRGRPVPWLRGGDSGRHRYSSLAGGEAPTVRNLRVASVQFEHAPSDKAANLAKVRVSSRRPPRGARRSSPSRSAASPATGSCATSPRTSCRRWPSRCSTAPPRRRSGPGAGARHDHRRRA